MDVSALAAMAAQQSVEALKASSQRHLAARARAMSPMRGPKASGRARGKALLAEDNAARLTEEVSLAQALESIPTPLTTPPRIQCLQYTTLTAHSPPPSFSPARRGDAAVPSNLSLWLGETFQALRPEEACCTALAPASGPKSTEDLPKVLPRRRFSGKRRAHLRGPLLEETRCTVSTLAPSATSEPKTPLPRHRLSGKGPAYRSATPVLPSQTGPAPSSQLFPSDEGHELQVSCLPSSQADHDAHVDAEEQQKPQRQQQKQQQEVVIDADQHFVSTTIELTKCTRSQDGETIIESTGEKQSEQEQKQYHVKIARRVWRQEDRSSDNQREQRQQQEWKGRRASRRKDKRNSLRLSGQAFSKRQTKSDADSIIDLDCSPVACSMKQVPPVRDTKQPFEQQCRHEAKRLPQPGPMQYRVTRCGHDSMPLEARAAKRPRSHNYTMKRLKPLKMPVSDLGKRRRRTGLAEVSSVVGAVLACLHSATPVPVVAVDIPLGEDID